VIQAKRYANTVGVSAVRDLYGTLMNDGSVHLTQAIACSIVIHAQKSSGRHRQV